MVAHDDTVHYNVRFCHDPNDSFPHQWNLFQCLFCELHAHTFRSLCLPSYTVENPRRLFALARSSDETEGTATSDGDTTDAADDGELRKQDPLTVTDDSLLHPDF